MSDTIDLFSGRYRFLSNFSPARVVLDGEEYPTVEHAYQAAKTQDSVWRKAIQITATPSEAKKMGRAISKRPDLLRPDWQSVSVDIMLALLRQKFAHPDLAEKLLSTGDSFLVEGNYWGDTFWGVCRGVGENVLGVLLMVVRYDLQERQERGGK